MRQCAQCGDEHSEDYLINRIYTRRAGCPKKNNPCVRDCPHKQESIVERKVTICVGCLKDLRDELELWERKRAKEDQDKES